MIKTNKIIACIIAMVVILFPRLVYVKAAQVTQNYQMSAEKHIITSGDKISLNVMGIPYNQAQNIYVFDTKYTKLIDSSGKILCALSSRVVAFYGESPATYEVWVWTSIEPGVMTASNGEYLTIPDDLTLSSYLNSATPYIDSSPKTQTPTTSYTVGISTTAAATPSLGASASVTTVKKTLEIYNHSKVSNNMFRMLFDYKQSNWYFNKGQGAALTSNLQNLACFVFTSSKGNPQLTISEVLTLGYAKENALFYNMWGYGESGIYNKIIQNLGLVFK